MRTSIVLLLFATCCHAETYIFGESDDAFEMEFVTIGDPGNIPDTRTSPQMGSVDYVYEIAKFETSCVMTRAAGLAGEQTMCVEFGEDYPAHMRWRDSARFVNWLNEFAGYSPAYKLSPNQEFVLWGPHEPGYDPDNPMRNALARFALPSRDEWHKAAYYDAASESYNLWSTGNTEPIRIGSEGGTEPNTAVYIQQVSGQFLADVTLAGGLSAYGTMGQDGNQGEWEEGSFNIDFPDSSRAYRVGAAGTVSADQISATRSREDDRFGYIGGFRVVAVTPVPEPSSLPLIAFALCSFPRRRR